MHFHYTQSAPNYIKLHNDLLTALNIVYKRTFRHKTEKFNAIKMYYNVQYGRLAISVGTLLVKILGHLKFYRKY